MNFVLMSTFNGEKFVGEQINSIICQQWFDPLHIIIRDDGSTDATVSIISEMQAKCTNHEIKITLIEAENIGVIESFHTLLRTINPKDDDLIFLSDQDDIWKPNRVNHIISIFEANSINCYCGALCLVDKNLNEIGYLNHLDLLGRPAGFPVISNFITGCTLCITGSAMKKLNFSVPTSLIPMHDWWIAVQIHFYSLSYFYDEYPTVLYRQHDTNVVGIKSIYQKLFSLKFWRNRFSSSAKIAQLALLDESSIIKADLLMQKRFFESQQDSIIGRLKIAKTFFHNARLSRWIIFVLLK